MRRLSRNLGQSLFLLFQPRTVFRGIEGGTPSGARARQVIRGRMDTWDRIEPHPSMGDYGDPSNREWEQYFVPDDSSALPERCPILVRGDAAEKPR